MFYQYKYEAKMTDLSDDELIEEAVFEDLGAYSLEYQSLLSFRAGTTNVIVKSAREKRLNDFKVKDCAGLEQDVTLSKEEGSLGFSIIGGVDHSSIPFGGKEPGIFISHMVPGGTAASSGKLRVGDRILKVNGEDITKCTHQESVMALLRPSDSITLTVRHDPLPEGSGISN